MGNMEYFAKIQEPKKLRLSMMNAARESIIMINLLEEIESLRQQKLELADSVREDFRNIGALCTEMSNLIADEKTREDVLKSLDEVPKEIEKKASSKIKKDEKYQSEMLPKIDPKAKTEVDRLEYTLKQIEDRIANLAK